MSQDSEHPIGKAIVAHAKAKGVELKDCNFFEISSGSGLKCYVSGTPVLVGNRSWLTQNKIPLSTAQDELAQAFLHRDSHRCVQRPASVTATAAFSVTDSVAAT